MNNILHKFLTKVQRKLSVCCMKSGKTHIKYCHLSVFCLKKFGGTNRVNMPGLSCRAYISQYVKFKIGSNILDVTHELLSQGWHSSYLMPSCEGCVLFMCPLTVPDESLLSTTIKYFVIIVDTGGQMLCNHFDNACQNLSSTVVINFSIVIA